MKKTICDKIFNKELKKNKKFFHFFINYNNYQKWLFEMLISFLWLRSRNNKIFFDFNKNANDINEIILHGKFLDQNLKEFYQLIEFFFKTNQEYLLKLSLDKALIRNENLKNIIIFIKNNFSEDIDFLINKIIKKTKENEWKQNKKNFKTFLI